MTDEETGPERTNNLPTVTKIEGDSVRLQTQRFWDRAHTLPSNWLGCHVGYRKNGFFLRGESNIPAVMRCNGGLVLQAFLSLSLYQLPSAGGRELHRHWKALA